MMTAKIPTMVVAVAVLAAQD
jgi:hypothetical protein